MVDETRLARYLIYIAIKSVDPILTRLLAALEERELIYWTNLGYVLRESVAIPFIKERFKEVLNSFVRQSVLHGIFNFEFEIKYMFELLSTEELTIYLVHTEPIIRNAAKARFDQLNRVLEI